MPAWRPCATRPLTASSTGAAVVKPTRAKPCSRKASRTRSRSSTLTSIFCHRCGIARLCTMPAVSTRALGRAVLLLAALSAGGLPACGDKTPPGPAETWPLTVSEPAVLGYAAVSLPRAELTSLLRSLLGWVPEGLADDRPFVALRLDSTTCGGPLAVMAPLADRRAFDASLKNNPLVQVTGEGRYRVRLPPESGLGMLLLLSSAGGMSSPTDILAALQRGIETDFPLQIEQRDGIAFAAPSFEALSLCRSLHERLDGPPPADVVLTVDLARVQTVYAEADRAAQE